MVTEVGTVKKEIAYHGDVINTTARIQSECNTYNASILISEELLSDMNLTDAYTTERIDNLLLKGKAQTVTICCISMEN